MSACLDIKRHVIKSHITNKYIIHTTTNKCSKLLAHLLICFIQM